MRPWQHAVSSAADRRSWQDDLDIHEFMDATKFACADRRHRIVLHHVDLGTEIAEMAFPALREVRAIVEQHVREDLGKPVSLADWWELCDESCLPKPDPRRIAGGQSGVTALVAGRVAKDMKGAIDRVCNLLFAPPRFLAKCSESLTPPPERGLPILMNSVGPMIARKVFGPPEPIGLHQTVVDYGWLAEAIIFTVYGRIPDLGEIVRCWRTEPTSHSSVESL